jgi:HAD superfamily hydrolase (TIGR01549 family)
VTPAKDLSAVIFDLDGTLTDTLPIAFSAFRAAVAAFTDRQFSDAELIASFGPSEDGILRRLIPEHWERCFERYVDEYAERHHACSAPFPGIEAALDVLKRRGVRLGLVTGKAARTAAITLERVRIAHYFDAVETGSSAGGVKPQAIRNVLHAWRADVGRAAYVGDAIPDMQAARAVGILGVGAASAGTATPGDLTSAGATVVFTNIEPFVGWLRG